MNTDESSSIKKENHFLRYLDYAAIILEKYNGKEPFHLYLKKYFSANKKHGSKDRKHITSLCYNYFRVGFAVSSAVDKEEKLLLAIFLIEKKSSPVLGNGKPEWNDKITLDLSAKIETVKDIFSVKKVFPFKEELSNEINFDQFSLSFLIQPKLFVRIRPGYKNSLFGKLNSAKIPFEKINETCLAFLNNEKVSNIINIDKEAVIQDYNSQRTIAFLTSYITCYKSSISVWDCCAASGGKSILAFDVLKTIELTVSDTRKNILENLHKRFAKAGINNYHSFVADLANSSSPNEMKEMFDLIIADVPCSGSGTWARTPEQLHFFENDKIREYSILQKKIVSNAAKNLSDDGYLLYITCSVFKEENEENIKYLQENLNLTLIESRYLKGYKMQADTLFTALLKNQNAEN